jgi:hypothetical protein
MSDALPYRCWCGVVGPEEELLRVEDLEPMCGGTRDIACFCGGDTCVCHHHGSVECPGCPDCDREGLAS